MLQTWHDGETHDLHADMMRLTLEIVMKCIFDANKESMRLYPPVAIFGREAATDTTIGDYDIPQGTVITISQWVMHRHPKYFTDPDAFQPERWTEAFEKQLPRGVYIPFGDGPRVGIAKGFAQMEAVLLLATIAQRFELDLDPDFEIVPQPSNTLRPAQGIRVWLKRMGAPVAIGDR
jgi:cytochrome P450